MAAPLPEAKSKPGEVMIIDVQVQGSERDDFDYTPKDDQEVFKDQCIVEVQQKWLTGEFFEAPIERWNFGENSQARLTLLLPAGCVASEGARLLKLRLGCDYMAKQEKPTSSKEDRAWSPMDWCTATSGRLPSLFGALYIFDFTMQKDFALEVAETLKLHRVRCPPWVVTIAQALKVEVKAAKPLAEPVDVPFETFERLVNDAVECDDDASYRTIVEKVLAGSDWPADKVMEVLVKAWLFLFQWELPVQEVTGDTALKKQTIGEFVVEGDESGPWLLERIKDLIQEHPDTAVTCHSAFFAGLKTTPTRFKVLRSNPSDGKTSIEWHRACVVTDEAVELRGVCAHALFLQSNLDWPGTKDAFTRFSKLSCQTVDYQFQDRTICDEDDQSAFIDPLLFGSAHPEAQRIWLELSQPNSLKAFRDNAEVVHPSARHLLLRNLSVLSAKDAEFLAKASLPSSKRSADEAKCTSAQIGNKKRRS